MIFMLINSFTSREGFLEYYDLDAPKCREEIEWGLFADVIARPQLQCSFSK